MNVPRNAFCGLILFSLVFLYPMQVKATWGDQQTIEFFEDLETKSLQFTEAKDLDALRRLQSRLLEAFSPGQLGEKWRPAAHYVNGKIEAGIASSTDNQQEKDAYFANAMQSFARSAAELPDFCPNYVMQSIILLNHFDEPEEALIKINRAAELCPDDQYIQHEKKYIIEAIAAKSAASNSSPSQAIPDKGKPAVSETAPSGGSRVFEPIPFD